MTTIKRIVAVFLSVMMLAAVCVTAASAEDANTLNIIVSKDNFEYAVYKIAELDKTDGSYTFPEGVDASVQNVVKTIQEATEEDSAGKVFRDQLDAIYAKGDGASKFGTVAGTVKKGAPFTATEDGIYYAAVTMVPSTYKEANNVVVVWPEYNKTSKSWDYNTYPDNTVDIGTKVNDGADSFDKNFTKYSSGKIVDDKAPKFKGLGDTVSYTLDANIVGTKDHNLKSFVFTDTMCPGLTYKNGSMKIYYGKDDVIDTSKDLLADGSFTMTKTGTTVFTISASSDLIGSDDFYDLTKHDKVYVQFEATVNSNAVIGKAGNPNTGSLSYTNDSDVVKTFDDVTIYVYTFKVTAAKKNGSDNSPLEGAKFVIKKGTTVCAYGTSDAEGNVVFREADNNTSAIYRFAPGNYTCEETEAPDGFALSTVPYSFEIKALNNPATQSDEAFNIKVNNGEAIANYPVKLPETGGTGTLMFTIIGGVLVLAAGAMFIIIMKKRSSSK